MESHNQKNLLTLIVVVINTCLFNPNLACTYLMPTTRGRSKPDQLLGQSQVFASNRGSGGVRCRYDEEKNDEEQNDAGENVNDSTIVKNNRRNNKSAALDVIEIDTISIFSSIEVLLAFFGELYFSSTMSECDTCVTSLRHVFHVSFSK